MRRQPQSFRIPAGDSETCPARSTRAMGPPPRARLPLLSLAMGPRSQAYLLPPLAMGPPVPSLPPPPISDGDSAAPPRARPSLLSPNHLNPSPQPPIPSTPQPSSPIHRSYHPKTSHASGSHSNSASSPDALPQRSYINPQTAKSTSHTSQSSQKYQ